MCNTRCLAVVLSDYTTEAFCGFLLPRSTGRAKLKRTISASPPLSFTSPDRHNCKHPGAILLGNSQPLRVHNLTQLNNDEFPSYPTSSPAPRHFLLPHRIHVSLRHLAAACVTPSTMSTTADEKIGPEHDQRLEHSPEYATKEQLEQYRLTDENAVEPGFWQTILKRGEYTAFYQEALDRYGEHAIDPLREARLKRKMDWIILPILAVCYFFYYVSHSRSMPCSWRWDVDRLPCYQVDKTTLSYAAIFGIREDLNLQGQEYAWLSSVFYFGWMACSYPFLSLTAYGFC